MNTEKVPVDTQKHITDTPEISVILPCLNEEKGLPFCIDEILETKEENDLHLEIIIVDNGSTDNSLKIAQSYSEMFPFIHSVQEAQPGYGSAYLKGFKECSGVYVFIADADGTYSFKDIPRFIAELRNGADLVVGDRQVSKLDTGIMPWHHKYIGNPMLSFLVIFFFKINLHDIHCGVRAIKKESFNTLKLYTRGMEFATEMIIKSARKGLALREIPIVYRSRLGRSKLESFVDGWRNLRFTLLYSPLLLFLLPGIVIGGLGVVSMLWLYFFNVKIFSIQLYVHPLFYSSLAILLGYQLIIFAGFSKIYSITHLGDSDKTLEKLFAYLNIEKGILFGILLFGSGALIFGSILYSWISSGLGALNEIKNSIVALTLLVIGIQTIFSSFMFSIVGIKEE